MCGITAIFGNSQYNSELLKQFVNKSLMSDRGPDTTSTIINNRYSIQFSRLKINDLSHLGMQPFFSKDKNCILVCNGEIYNHKKIESELELNCESKSDCECIIKGYEKIGNHIFELIEGEFALLLFVLSEKDRNNDFVYVYRDRFGVRPMYQGELNSEKNKLMCFGSTARYIDNFCNNIKQVDCGKVMVYNRNGYDKTLWERTLNLNYENAIFDLFQIEEIKYKIRTCLISAVKKRCESDRPVCCMLSGGLDSSIITSILVSICGKEKIHAFSIGMEGSIDVEYAKKVAKYLDIQHTIVNFTEEEGFKVIPEVIRNLGTYDITTIRASVGMYLLAKYISENTNYKVVLTGEGSDELFCGYLYFHYAPNELVAIEESNRLLSELHLYDVLRVDRCIASNGLEARVPFLDENFIDFVSSLPPWIKVPLYKSEKWLLRTAFETMLPNEIVWRRKDGFSDGVSSVQRPWYIGIQEQLNKLNLGLDEKNYYKMLFEKEYKNYRPEIATWLPKWRNTNGNPSGRLLSIFNEN